MLGPCIDTDRGLWPSWRSVRQQLGLAPQGEKPAPLVDIDSLFKKPLEKFGLPQVEESSDEGGEESGDEEVYKKGGVEAAAAGDGAEGRKTRPQRGSKGRRT